MTEHPIESGFYWAQDYEGGPWEPQRYDATRNEWWLIGCEYTDPRPPLRIGPMIHQYDPGF